MFIYGHAQYPSKIMFSTHRRAQQCDVINITDSGMIEVVLCGDLALAASLRLKHERCVLLLCVLLKPEKLRSVVLVARKRVSGGWLER